jgi:eukaryotic-like serine/threonine-protein kinase
MENSGGMTPESVGTRKGDYEILGLLGAGGMGQVYKVRNVHSDRIEAMKVLLPSLAGQSNLAERFVREIKVLAALHHPNIAELRTALMIDNQLVMIMEYVDGATLAARVQQGPIPYGQALSYIEQALSALSYAHKQHVIHRDIKPANMMLTPDGVVKLMDFGIARKSEDSGLTLTNTTLGSLAYMSPEQIRDETTDARSDLYSVGVSLYELVTGQRPFNADTAFSTMQAHLQTPARPPIELKPDLPPAISSLILMAIAKEPAKRFQSADAFAAAIRSVSPKLEGTAAALPPSITPISFPPAGATVTASAVPSNAAASMPLPAARPPAHRGLYITLGAVIVIVVLVVASIYIPSHSKISAFWQKHSSPVSVAVAPGADSDSETPPKVSVSVGSGGVSVTVGDPAAAAATPAASASAAQPNSAAAMKPAATPAAAPQQAAPAPPPGPDPQQLQALGDQIDQVSSRAAAVNGSLETLQKQQAAQGLGLRGDMVAAQQRMQSDIAKAESALQAKDVDSAQRYIDQASAETEKLEHFLGR